MYTYHGGAFTESLCMQRVGLSHKIFVFCFRYSGIEMHMQYMAFLSRLLVCSPMGLITGRVPSHFSFTREWGWFLLVCRAQLLAGERFGGRCFCVCVDYTPEYKNTMCGGLITVCVDGLDGVSLGWSVRVCVLVCICGLFWGKAFLLRFLYFFFRGEVSKLYHVLECVRFV